MALPSMAIKITPLDLDVSELTVNEQRELRDAALTIARASIAGSGSDQPHTILEVQSRKFAQLERELHKIDPEQASLDVRTLYENGRQVRSVIADLQDAVKVLDRLPRCLTFARALVSASGNNLTVVGFTLFIDSLQGIDPLRNQELQGMLPAVKLTLLENTTDVGFQALAAFQSLGKSAPPFNAGLLIRSFRLIGDIDWKETLEQLSIVHRLLSLDPAGVYPRMELESREIYRRSVEKIAKRSDMGEIELCERLVKAATEARVNANASAAFRNRQHHIGYYLIDEIGGRQFLRSIGYRPPVSKFFELLFHRFPDEVYIIGIELITLVTVVTLIMSLVRYHHAWGIIMGALLLIIPATQAAVELMNYFVTAVLTPRPLSKMDYSESVEPASATMVAIPTLLINEKQIRQLIEDMEVRYLVNRDPNIFYALLTDLPDSAEPPGEKDSRVDLAIGLLDALNQKYRAEPHGGFYLFHRHRVYNPREGAWMGWERKRGKLLDLNQMLRGVFDPFPVKAGDMSRLPHIQYVLTLDSDTQLPRGSAQRLIGTIAHPLNRALIDPDLNIVTTGYGILQPRVGISVQSATRSRLASIYSGQTGFDIYSRAVSDVYQDLYGEGIFTGKGIYDVDALRQVLERRFPRNALLSHDLIEGAYARAGLVSDIEVIDDYPSHYSAYNRRKHRWLRGDWQIVRWIFSSVPDESGRSVPNPISTVSKWKIFDNLRRSLVEPATFLLLLAGWFVLPGGPRFWTLVTLALLVLPIYFRLAFSLLRAAIGRNLMAARDAVIDFFTAHFSIFLNIAFLAHQTLVSLDAIIRTIIRSTITHSRLLEWETATEAELGIKKRTPVDIYLDWIPLLAIVLGALLYFYTFALPFAAPFLLVWLVSKLISNWLNSSPHPTSLQISENERKFLHEVALRTWRFFAELSHSENHWLIPDNIQQVPCRYAERLSPTNLGLLLNSRQAALQFGYLTLREFATLTENTLESMSHLPRQFGHFLNWYDNLTRSPLEPSFVSSVDSGNLVASLWSLKQGCLEYLREPLFRSSAAQGLLDYHAILPQAGYTLPRAGTDTSVWLSELLKANSSQMPASASNADDYWTAEYRSRLSALHQDVQAFAPWLLPEFGPLRNLDRKLFDVSIDELIPSKSEAFFSGLQQQLRALLERKDLGAAAHASAALLSDKIPDCRLRVKSFAQRLQKIANTADRLVQEMDFEMLVDKRRALLSIGYDITKQELNKSCYDLLASESRTATFITVAKGETTQDSWFRLGRTHTLCEGETVLVSWTGTMFEYLMPAIWERSHPNTLLDRATRSAVRAQQAYGRSRKVPWGISEAAYSQKDADGNYGYSAFGVPGLALSVSREKALVVSPYSSCLALQIDVQGSVRNLLLMAKRKWLAEYGFYESIDYHSPERRRFSTPKPEIVHCWMAHHQGMSLAALCNVLHDFPFQRWFHAEPLVQASDLILQERPIRVRPIADSHPRRVLRFGRNIATNAAEKEAASL